MELRTWLSNPKNYTMFLLFQAYLDARKGKRNTYDEHVFEVNLWENLDRLADAILTEKYRPGSSKAHVIFHPVVREIFAASFRDRVIHHYIYNVIGEWWENRFINDSYSCRKGKGVLYGIKRLQHFMRSAWNETLKTGETVYVVKYDIKGYFMHLDRQTLLKFALDGLDQQFAGRKDQLRYKTTKFLLEQIIMDDPVSHVRKVGRESDWKYVPRDKSLFFQPPGRGIVIGNLTSQLLSNIFLDHVLDKFVFYNLGYRRYGRYVDDFYFIILQSELKQFFQDMAIIEGRLNSFGVTLHPNKRYIQPIDKGVEFLGCKVYVSHIIPSQRFIKNMRKAFKEVATGRRDPSTIISYMGHAKHFNAEKLMKEAFDKMGWDYQMSSSSPRKKAMAYRYKF